MLNVHSHADHIPMLAAMCQHNYEICVNSCLSSSHLMREVNVVEHLREYEDLEVEDENAITEEIIADWKFFSVSHFLTSAILSLNERLGAEYFKKEYDKLEQSEKIPDLSETSREDEHDEGIKEGVARAWNALFHEEENARDSPQSEEEVLSDFQGFLSERIFNHLAMLSRSSYARIGTYSIREELTMEVADKIGLGLYLHHKTSPTLRAESESVLLRLAKEFQCWLVDEHRGLFFTSWGVLCSDKSLLGKNALVMDPDVKESEGNVDSNAPAPICSESIA